MESHFTSSHEFIFSFLIPGLTFRIFSPLQAESSTMCHAKFAEITARANIMVSTLAMDALGSSNVPLDVVAHTFANRRPTDCAWSTKHTEISVELVGSKNASKLE